MCGGFVLRTAKSKILLFNQNKKNNGSIWVQSVSTCCKSDSIVLSHCKLLMYDYLSPSAV